MMTCPDCKAKLRGDGSCCDDCGWVLVGGGGDPRLPSQRTSDQIVREQQRRTRVRLQRDGRTMPLYSSEAAELRRVLGVAREALGQQSFVDNLDDLWELHGDWIEAEGDDGAMGRKALNALQRLLVEAGRADKARAALAEVEAIK